MERLLSDYLVEHTDESGACYSMTCAICGKNWRSKKLQTPDAFTDGARDVAAREAAENNRMCNFCGRPVCENCYEDFEGILLCVKCGQKLRDRLETK